MKKLLVVFAVVLIAGNVQAQKKVLNTPTYDLDPLHFGFTLGFNSMDFNIYLSNRIFTTDTVYSVNAIRQLGFNIGIVSNLRLGKYFDLRFLPGISFGQRNLEYLIWKDNHFTTKTMKIESTFLEFPLTLKYKAKRISNYRPYIVTGLNYRADLAAQKDIKEDEKPKVRLEQNDLYYEIGFGVDYYLPFFKLSTELKYGVGLNNVIISDGTQFTGCIEKMVSNIFVMSFHFE